MTRSAAALAQKQEHTPGLVVESIAARPYHQLNSSTTAHEQCNAAQQDIGGDAGWYQDQRLPGHLPDGPFEGAGTQPPVAGLGRPHSAQGLLRTASLQRGGSLAESAALLQQLVAQEGVCGLLDDAFMAAMHAGEGHRQPPQEGGAGLSQHMLLARDGSGGSSCMGLSMGMLTRDDQRGPSSQTANPKHNHQATHQHQDGPLASAPSPLTDPFLSDLLGLEMTGGPGVGAKHQAHLPTSPTLHPVHHVSPASHTWSTPRAPAAAVAAWPPSPPTPRAPSHHQPQQLANPYTQLPIVSTGGSGADVQVNRRQSNQSSLVAHQWERPTTSVTTTTAPTLPAATPAAPHGRMQAVPARRASRQPARSCKRKAAAAIRSMAAAEVDEVGCEEDEVYEITREDEEAAAEDDDEEEDDADEDVSYGIRRTPAGRAARRSRGGSRRADASNNNTTAGSSCAPGSSPRARKAAKTTAAATPANSAASGSQGGRGVLGVTGPAAGSGEGDEAKPRSSRFRGVTRHRRSGRWEAHIWIKEVGRQVYLGGYENEEHAAEAYDVAALKTKGSKVRTNFPPERYADLLSCMDAISLEELVMAVRRQSQGFSRGSSSYRGVTAHPSGRWESRIGIPGSKHVYLGLYAEERDAASAYDRALVRLRGTAAATNFALSEYRRELAEFHQAQQACLLGDKRVEAVMQTGPDFEKWVKLGASAFPFMVAAFVAAAEMGNEVAAAVAVGLEGPGCGQQLATLSGEGEESGSGDGEDASAGRVRT